MKNQKSAKWVRAIALLALAIANGAISPEADAQSVPQVIYMTRKGLDVRHNEIDRLINIFGFVCEHSPRFPRACRIESELLAFLKALPANRDDIARELTALGAACQRKEKLLDCRYERNVENAGWIVGTSEPVNIIDEFFRIDLSVSGADSALHYESKFDRTSKLRAPAEE